MEVHDAFLDMPAGQVHYLQTGSGGAATIVLLHGASFSAETWREIGTIERLVDAGFHVVALDVPGFGKSPAVSIDQQTWLQDVLDQLGMRQRVAVVSPSMSGAVSLPLLAGKPERLSAFVAVAPIAIPDWLDRLTDCQVPLLAVWGADDHLIPRKYADGLVERLPDARLIVIPEAGHAPYMNNPDAFHEAVIGFLREKTAEPTG